MLYLLRHYCYRRLLLQLRRKPLITTAQFLINSTALLCVCVCFVFSLTRVQTVLSIKSCVLLDRNEDCLCVGFCVLFNQSVFGCICPLGETEQAVRAGQDSSGTRSNDTLFKGRQGLCQDFMLVQSFCLAVFINDNHFIQLCLLLFSKHCEVIVQAV